MIIQKMYYGIATILDALHYLVFSFLHRRSVKQIEASPKSLWLFCERGSDARDNAFFLYDHVRTHHPEINAHYVIDRESKETIDYKRVERIGNIVHRGSVEHRELFLAADVLVSAHFRGYIEPWRIRVLKVFFKGYLQKKFIFLQHGVIKDDMSNVLHKDKTHFDLFIAGAKPEYDYLLKTLGYTEKVLKYTGLARYDHLHDFTVKDQILIMPTWRQYIADAIGENISEGFETTKYYQYYQQLLDSKDFHEYLEEQGLTVIFYPHYEMQRYCQKFTTDSSRITIATKEKYDIQTLLKESKLLITDYSSVFMDLAYMRKAILYFQFDETEFFTGHWKRGYFNYRKDGFGPVCFDGEQVLNELSHICDNHFEMTDEYRERAEKFFPLHDRNNCKRIVHEIKKIL